MMYARLDGTAFPISPPQIIWLLVLVLGMSGCASIGPATVSRDRVDYIAAVSESWKEQTLLNIVRMRYGDAPTFVDVSSVISAYSLQGQLLAGGQLSSDLTNTIPSRLFNLGGSATYIDRPTITYTPVTGDRFARSLLRPIPPNAIFELIQVGYPADAILQMTTRAINGVYNRSTLAQQVREADPQFYPVLDALRRLQLSGAISVRLERRGGNETGVVILSAERGTEVDRDLLFLRRALGISPGKNGEISLTFGALPRTRNEIALLSRSMLGILLEIASGIEVPRSHVQEGRTAPAARVAHAQEQRDRPMIHIMSGPTEPQRPFATVRYRNTAYWVSDDDLASKRVFTFLMMFFSLAETGVMPQAPVLTIPAN